MTDTVNVPREWLEEIAGYLGATNKNDWSGLEPNDAMRGSHCVRVGALMELRDMLAAAPKAEPVSGDWYSAESIDALVREIDIALNGDKAAPQAKLCDIVKQVKELAHPEAPKVEQEPVAWAYRTVGGDWKLLKVSKYGKAEGVPLYRHPAPASDELLEALRELIGRAKEVRNMLNAHPLMQGREHVSMGVALNGAIARGQRAYDAQHKGPQS